MGGEVTNFKDGNYGPYRVYKNNGDSSPGLAIARSLGDLMAHECGVSEIPQISFKIIDSQDEFIVIGSDGIWDVMNSVEIVGFIFEKIEEVGKERIAEEIVEECRKRWHLINRYKDEAFIERIMSDSTVNANTKNFIQNNYNQQLNNQNNSNNSANTTGSSSNIGLPGIGGQHTIDDITCVILFFKS
jgi:topoisomerase IA-like protein